MAIEPIGKTCECIYLSSDKRYLLMGLNGIISSAEIMLEKTKDDLAFLKEEERQGALYKVYQDAKDTYQKIISDAKAVKERVSATKVCT